MLGKPRIYHLSPTCFINLIKHEHSYKILYVSHTPLLNAHADVPSVTVEVKSLAWISVYIHTLCMQVESVHLPKFGLSLNLPLFFVCTRSESSYMAIRIHVHMLVKTFTARQCDTYQILMSKFIYNVIGNVFDLFKTTTT